MNPRDAEKEGLLIRGRNLAVEKAVSRASFVMTSIFSPFLSRSKPRFRNHHFSSALLFESRRVDYFSLLSLWVNEHVHHDGTLDDDALAHVTLREMLHLSKHQLREEK